MSVSVRYVRLCVVEIRSQLARNELKVECSEIGIRASGHAQTVAMTCEDQEAK